MKAGMERAKSEYIELPVRPVPLSSHNGENSVEFNNYILIYSNNVSGNLWSPWRAGVTQISCYKDNDFVGVISFYETTENLHGGYIDPNGVIVIEYPIAQFEDVMRTLRTFNNLSLLFVEKDLQGTPLAHPVGAVMTFEHKSIGA
jgi:hypothetical protein